MKLKNTFIFAADAEYLKYKAIRDAVSGVHLDGMTERDVLNRALRRGHGKVNPKHVEEAIAELNGGK